MADTNIFGGGNANSLYTPMSEVEQEAVSRLVSAGDLRVIIGGWGPVDRPRVTFGDLRLAVAFRLLFDRPEIPIPVYHFDLELRTGGGHLLYKDRLPTVYGGKPIQVAQGVFLDLVWDIAVRSVDPNLVKAVVPGATGLTSRLQDKDTGLLTLTGNMRLSTQEKQALKRLRNAETMAKADTARRVRLKK